jgi:hypothetical protein
MRLREEGAQVVIVGTGKSEYTGKHRLKAKRSQAVRARHARSEAAPGSMLRRFVMARWSGRVVEDIPDFCRELISAIE